MVESTWYAVSSSLRHCRSYENETPFLTLDGLLLCKLLSDPHLSFELLAILGAPLLCCHGRPSLAFINHPLIIFLAIIGKKGIEDNGFLLPQVNMENQNVDRYRILRAPFVHCHTFPSLTFLLLLRYLGKMSFTFVLSLLLQICGRMVEIWKIILSIWTQTSTSTSSCVDSSWIYPLTLYGTRRGSSKAETRKSSTTILNLLTLLLKF